MDLQQAFDEGFDALKGYVDRSFDVFAKQIAALEKRIADMPAPQDGKDADVAAIAAQVHGQLEPAILELGKSVAALETSELPDIGAMIAEAIAALPAPADGKSVTVEELAPVVAEAVQRAVAALPSPKDGCGIKELIIDREGGLVATMEDGRINKLGPVVGRDGIDVDLAAVERSIAEKVAAIPVPKDGADGLGFDDMDLVEGNGGIALRFMRGDVVKEFPVPIVTDCGVFDEDREYRKGNGVTWGGSFWIAQQDNPEGKPDTGKGWRLSVKKGRDGKHGRDLGPKEPPIVKVG